MRTFFYSTGETINNNQINNDGEGKNINLISIYRYFISHPLCQFRNMPYQIFATSYKNWLEAKYN
jgi:hypothetical protein